MRRSVFGMSVAVMLAACGGSGSETPPPIEPATPRTQPSVALEDTTPPATSAGEEPSQPAPEGESATPPVN